MNKAVGSHPKLNEDVEDVPLGPSLNGTIAS